MAIHEVRVASIEKDVKGQEVTHEAQRIVGVPGLEKIRTVKVYRVEGATEVEAKVLAQRLFSEPINQEYTLNSPLITDAQRVVEVAYKPGVMNPEVDSILKSAKNLGVDLAAADSSTEYGFYGNVTQEQVDYVVDRLLVNKTAQRIVYKKPETLIITGELGPVTLVPIRDASIEQLQKLNQNWQAFANDEELLVVQKYFQELGREPTDCEFNIIFARWSEHCGHKTFKAKVIADGVEKPPLFTRITETARKYFGEEVLSAFVDNSGVMKFYDGQAVCGKVETHNSPSAIEPYGGAGTGSGGVFRDIMGTGQGAKVITSTDMFCFAPPDLDPAKLPEGTLNPDYLQRRVVAGVRDYGNRMGIPTNNGSIHYHEDFRAKPTVIVGAYGILPESKAQKGKPQLNDLVVAIGGRTGRDGIHGATFSSGEMTERTINVNSSAVQIGNAIEEKRMEDAILEARDNDLIRAITDCGAAGFSSAIGEMGEDIGVNVDISRAPLKYPGLAPWEIWMSESQERMVTAIAPDKIDEFKKICKKYNVEATVLGHFDESNRLKVMYQDQTVANLDYEFLKNGMPQRIMKARYEKPVFEEIDIPMPRNNDEWVEKIKKVLSHGNVCSKEPIVRQYDHSVQGTNALPPFTGVNYDGPNDAIVINPILDKPYGMVVSHGKNPILNRIDPYWGTIWAATEAASNYTAVGGDLNKQDAGLINNYIWPFPDEESMGSLDLAVDAVCDFMDSVQVGVNSGKDSLSSTYKGKSGEVIKIPPVVCISVYGKIPDVEQTVTSDIKKAGSTLCLVGQLDNNMGGSTYYDINGLVGNEVPKVNLQVLPKVLKGIHRAIKSGEVLSCHDVSEGGVIGAVSEMCFGGDCGAEVVIDGRARLLDRRGSEPEGRDFLHDKRGRIDHFLFNETAGCFVVEVQDEETANKLFENLPHMILGKSKQEKEISVNVGGHTLFNASVDELKQAWREPIKKIFH